MAHVSQFTKSRKKAAVIKLPQEPDCELMNIETANDSSQSDIFKVLPNDTLSGSGHNHSGEDLKDRQISPEICRSHGVDLESKCPVITTETDQEQNKQWNLTGWHPEDWRLINFEPSAQVHLICPEAKSHEDYMSLAQPGPSTVKGHNNYDFSVSIPGQQCHPQSSSRRKCSEEGLPGPSKIKVHSTILKKTSERLPHTEHIFSDQLEQFKSTSIAHQYLDPPEHSSQFVQPLRQSTEKENQKRVRFEPRSECELLTLCDRECMGHAPGTKCPSPSQIIRAMTRGVENIDDEDLLVGSTTDVLHSHLLQENDKENTKGMDTKAALQSNISVAVNENVSANNRPTEDKQKRIENVPSHENGEIEAVHQPVIKMENQGSTISRVKLFDHSLDNSKLDTTTRIRYDTSQLGTDVASQPEICINKTDNIVVHEADKKKLSHTEKMVALFTNLQVNQMSPLLQSEKSKRVKPLEGKIADYIQCFGERITNDDDKRSTLLTTNKTEKLQTLFNTKPSTALQSSNLDTLPQTSRKIVQNFDLHREKACMLNTSKQSVEAVLLVLHSMQSILFRMAKTASSKIVGSTEHDEFLKDPLKRKRKKRPWESACPNDSEVTPDGLFAYSIAHQVIGQAFKKITELYPTCANWEQLDSVSEREFVDRNSASVILALTAMKDAFRELEGPTANKFYTSTAVATSDSLTNVSTENILDEENGFENIVRESRSVVLDIIREVIERATNASTEIHEDRNKTDQASSPNCASDAQDDSLNTELKRMSFELVSRTVREAVSGLLKTKVLSVSDTACDRIQPPSVQGTDSENKTSSDTETLIHMPCSTTTSENLQQEDQPVVSLVQSISNEIHDLISKLFCHLESTDCREKLDFLMTDIGKDLSTSVDVVCDKCNTVSSKPNVTNRTLEENDSNLASVAVQSKTSCREEAADSSTHTECTPGTKNMAMKHSSLESQRMSSDIDHLPCSALKEHRQKELFTPQCILGTDSQGMDSEHSVLGEESCQSNESTKCRNSSSQTANSSIEHFFDLDLENSSSGMTSEDHLLDGTSSQDMFEYSTPSTLLGMQIGENSREGNILESVDFGHLYMVQSSDMWVSPATLLQMSGGNHPEHVQQADQNRPSCSQCPNGQNTVQQVPDNVALSKSMTTAKDKQKACCWNTQCCAHHQTRPSKLVGNVTRNKQSCSEPKLDFYKRTKAQEYSIVRKQFVDSQESDMSEWSVFSFYPPRDTSDASAPKDEEERVENIVIRTKLDEHVGQAVIDFNKIGGACSQENAASQSSGAISSKDEPGCLSTDTDISTNASLEKQHAVSSTEHKKEAELMTDVRNNESEHCFRENNTSSAVCSTSKDNVRSVLDEQGFVWQDQDKASMTFEKKEHCSVSHLSEQTLNAHHFSSIDQLPSKMPRLECSIHSHSVSKVHSACDFKCQRLELSSDIQPHCKKRESSLTSLNDPAKNPQEDFVHKSCKYLTSHQCSNPHSNNNLEPGVNNSAVLPSSQMHQTTREHHQPLSYSVSQSSCCSSSTRPAESEFEKDHRYCKRHCNSNEETLERNCGCSARHTLSIEDICSRRDTTGEVAEASECEKCASLDSQLQRNNTNINGIGRGIQNSASNIRTSTTSTATGQDSTVDRVQDKFLQLQRQLNVGVDSLKDYIVALCSTLKNDQTPGEETVCRDSKHHPVCFPSSCSCHSPSSPCLHRMPHRLNSCNRHSPTMEVTPCPCCISHCKRKAAHCEEKSATVVSPTLYSLCQDSGKHAETCYCCSDPRHSPSVPGCPSPITDNVNKGTCCQSSHVDINARPSLSTTVACVDIPQIVCLYCPGDSSTSMPSQCHCVCQGKHSTVPETSEPSLSKSEVADLPQHFNHSRICRLRRTRCHRVKKNSPCMKTRRNRVPSASVSFKDSRSSMENSDSENTFHNKIGAETAGATSSFEQNNYTGTKGNTAHVHRTMNSPKHSFRVSPRSVDVAVSIVKTLLKIQNSTIPDPLKHPVPCHRVGSSSVDGEIHSSESQTKVQCKHSAEREKCVCNIFRNILSDVANQKFHTIDPKLQSTDSMSKSEKISRKNRVESSEAKCICCSSPVHGCSEISCEVDNFNESLASGLFLGQPARRQDNDCGKPDRQKADLPPRCSLKSQKLSGAKTNKKNRCNSSASKCSTFLVCIGEENDSSALFLQPLISPKIVQFRDTACQASDESVCTSFGMSNNWAERGTSDMSIASSFRSTPLEGENQGPADNRKKSSRSHGAVICDSPSSLSSEGCESSSSITDSVSTVKIQPHSSPRTGGTQRKRKSHRNSESRSSSIHVLQGVCEISHSSCETCQKDSDLPASVTAAASSHPEKRPVALGFEPTVIDHILEKAEDAVKNNDTTHPSKIADLQEPKGSQNTVCRMTSFTDFECLGKETKTLTGKIICTIPSDGIVDPVSEVGFQGVSRSSSAELQQNSAPVCSDSGNVDAKFQAEIMPAASCESSHVDPSFPCTDVVSADLIETCHSSSCVDFSFTSGESHNTSICMVLAPGTGETSGQKRVETEKLSESNSPPFKEADNVLFKDTQLCVENPVSGQTESDSAGGDPSFPVDFTQCQLKGISHPMTEGSVDGGRSEANTGCFLSQSGFLSDSFRPGTHKQHNNSPSSSLDSISTTAVTSSSSAANLSLSSSPVDPFMDLCSSDKPCPESVGFTNLTLDSKTCNSASECAQEQEPSGTHTSVCADDSTSMNNSHKGLISGSGIAVDCSTGIVDGDMRVRRSFSSEQLCGGDRTDQSGTRDSWMSLQMLNLRSRATRLAIESRVQSLQQILNKMESCTQLPPSECLASQQQLSSHRTTSSVTAASASAAAAAAASPKDHWLRACSSEELVQVIYQQLQRLKTRASLEKRLQSTTLPESEVGDNTNTNHVSSRDACTSISFDTHSIGTITDICQQAAWTHCFCTMEKFNADSRVAGNGVKIDVMCCVDAAAFSTINHSQGNVRVSFPDNVDTQDSKSGTMENSAFARVYNSINERCMNQNVQAIENISKTGVPEVVDKSVATDTDNIKVDDMNYSKSLSVSDVCKKAVVTEGIYLKLSTRDFSDSFGVQEKTARGVNVKLGRQRPELVDFSDSITVNTKVQRGVNFEDLGSTHVHTSGSVKDVPPTKREDCLENTDRVLSIVELKGVDSCENSIPKTNSESAENNAKRIALNFDEIRFDGIHDNHCEYCPSDYEMEPIEDSPSASDTELSKTSTSGLKKNQYAGNRFSMITINKLEDRSTDLDKNPVKSIVDENDRDSSENTCEVDYVENGFTDESPPQNDFDRSDTDFTKCSLKGREIEPICTSVGGSDIELVESTLEGSYKELVPNGVQGIEMDPTKNAVHHELKPTDNSINGKSQNPATNNLDGQNKEPDKNGMSGSSMDSSVDSALDSCLYLQSTREALSGPDHHSRRSINTADKSRSNDTNCIDRIETRITDLFSFLRDSRKTSDNFKRELEDEKLAMASFGATFSKHNSKKGQKLNATRNQGVCATLQEDFTQENTTSFSNDSIAMTTKEFDCLAMAVEDNTVRQTPPSIVSNLCKMEMKEVCGRSGTKEELKSDCASRNTTDTINLSSHTCSPDLTTTSGAAEEMRPELTLKIVLAPFDAGLSKHPKEQVNSYSVDVKKSFPEEERTHGTDATGQYKLQKEGKHKLSRKFEDVANEDNSSFRHETFGSDVGIQCNILTSSSFARPRSRDAENYKPRHLTAVSKTFLSSEESKTVAAKNSFLAGEHTTEGRGVKQYRQRVRSLEQALDLERDLHHITRSSLSHLASDHDRFRHHMLRLHRVRNRSTGDRRWEMWKREEERTGAESL